MTQRWHTVAMALLATARSVAQPSAAPAVATSQGPAIYLVTAVDSGQGRAYLGYLYDNSHRPVRVLDTASGAFLPSIPLPADNQFSALAVDSRAHRVYLAYYGYSTTAGVRTLDTRTGTIVRIVSIVPEPDAIAVDEHAGLVYVASAGYSRCALTDRCLDTGTNEVRDAIISVLDARHGTLVRTLTVRHVTYTGALVAVDGRARRVVLVSAAEATSQAEAGTDVSVLDALTGQLARRVHLAGGGALPPVVDEATRRAYVATTVGHGGRVDLFDTRSGVRVRTIRLDSAPLALAVGSASPGAPGNGYIAVTTLGPTRRERVATSNGNVITTTVSIGRGSLSIVDARSGALLHSVAVGIEPQALAIDARRGRIVVANVAGSDRRSASLGGGSVSIVDARTGATLRTAPLGISPLHLALDTRTGHAIVVGYGGYTGLNSVDVVDDVSGVILRTELLP